jgi:hypothetical protein
MLSTPNPPSAENLPQAANLPWIQTLGHLLRHPFSERAAAFRKIATFIFQQTELTEPDGFHTLRP